MRRDLAEVIQRHTQSTEELDALNERLTEAASRPRPTGAFDPRREALRQRHLEGMRQDQDRRREALRKLDGLMEAAQQKVVQAHREVKAMEVLQDRDRAAWEKENRRLEEREADEQNAQRFKRD